MSGRKEVDLLLDALITTSSSYVAGVEESSGKPISRIGDFLSKVSLFRVL